MIATSSRLSVPFERRRTNRLRRRAVALLVGGPETIEARLVDVTAGGLSLRTHTRVQHGVRYRLFLRSPGKEEIQGHLEVRWCGRTSDGSGWLAGGPVEAEGWARFVAEQLDVRGQELIRKRHDVRLRHFRRIVFADAKDARGHGSLLDVSLTGLRFFARELVVHGDVLRLSIRGWLTVEGTVVRVRRADGGFEIGVALRPLAEEDQRRFERCLAGAWDLGGRASSDLRRRHPAAA